MVSLLRFHSHILLSSKGQRNCLRWWDKKSWLRMRFTTVKEMCLFRLGAPPTFQTRKWLYEVIRDDVSSETNCYNLFWWMAWNLVFMDCPKHMIKLHNQHQPTISVPTCVVQVLVAEGCRCVNSMNHFFADSSRWCGWNVPHDYILEGLKWWLRQGSSTSCAQLPCFLSLPLNVSRAEQW